MAFEIGDIVRILPQTHERMIENEQRAGVRISRPMPPAGAPLTVYSKQTGYIGGPDGDQTTVYKLYWDDSEGRHRCAVGEVGLEAFI